MKFVALIVLSLTLLIGASAQQCGRQARGARCRDNLCCSQYGWCGSSDEYCGFGCQSQCRRLTSTSTSAVSGEGGSGVANLISPATFGRMLKYRNDGLCPSNGLHKHDAFIAAAKAFSGFGTTGDVVTRKRELAAFLAQTSHETTGGWASGYCRGPIQLTHNYNYAQASKAIGADLINNPELVATDPVVSFKTAIWFWMTPQSSKPSSHDVILGKWNPSSADRSAGRVPGYGVVTNIINGGLECGKGQNDKVASRIGFYKKYCEILGVSPGNNLDCYNQKPFA